MLMNLSGFLPAAALTPQDLQAIMPLALYALVALVQEFPPAHDRAARRGDPDRSRAITDVASITEHEMVIGAKPVCNADYCVSASSNHLQAGTPCNCLCACSRQVAAGSGGPN
ncbi:MAG: hypothetical protein ACLP3Q_26710 [Streptosporangiaceae bacterium]